CREIFLTATPQAGESIEPMFARLADVVRLHRAKIVSQIVFHLADRRSQAIRTLEEVLGEIRWPITWLEDGDSFPDLIGTHVHAIVGPDVEVLQAESNTVGCVYDDPFARVCVLGDLRDEDVSHTRGEQARLVLESMADTLDRADMQFAHVARTWFFNDDILGWYGEFNLARDAFFTDQGVFEGLVPASTGIGGGNPFGAALQGGLVAFKPNNGSDVRTFVVPSPLQSSARDYGSSFSRAVEVQMPDHRRLYISGTASIDTDGEVQHIGDVEAQIEFTMQVVQEILTSRGMDWCDVVGGIVYVRNAADTPAFERYCASHGLGELPLVVTCNTVCRDEWLFEIELQAIAGNVGPAVASKKTIYPPPDAE
ncbi:MAG TPA: hypothetical protein ENL03_03785, partial [Phycisphaerae bacterium]|nr:hypothetical protein [Phycisphaerae bacterium]